LLPRLIKNQTNKKNTDEANRIIISIADLPKRKKFILTIQIDDHAT